MRHPTLGEALRVSDCRRRDRRRQTIGPAPSNLTEPCPAVQETKLAKVRVNEQLVIQGFLWSYFPAL